MIVMAWIAGIVAGLCMVMGIVTATEIIQPLGVELTWVFWLALSGVLFLATIALTLGSGESEY